MGKKPDQVRVDVGLGFLKLSGTWSVSDQERSAAWALYVELATRVSTVPLDAQFGLLREALSSLHELFAVTRTLLKDRGVEVAKPRKGRLSFGVISVAVLNGLLRPFVAKWHPLLEDYESTKEASVSRLAHETAWPLASQMRAELKLLQSRLRAYAGLLEQAAGLAENESMLVPEPSSQ